MCESGQVNLYARWYNHSLLQINGCTDRHGARCAVGTEPRRRRLANWRIGNPIVWITGRASASPYRSTRAGKARLYPHTQLRLTGEHHHRLRRFVTEYEGAHWPSGIAIHTAARVSALASTGEILVSSTVRELVAGSGLRFHDRGMHSLRGLPEPLRLFLAEL